MEHHGPRSAVFQYMYIGNNIDLNQPFVSICTQGNTMDLDQPFVSICTQGNDRPKSAVCQYVYTRTTMDLDQPFVISTCTHGTPWT